MLHHQAAKSEKVIRYTWSSGQSQLRCNQPGPCDVASPFVCFLGALFSPPSVCSYLNVFSCSCFHPFDHSVTCTTTHSCVPPCRLWLLSYTPMMSPLHPFPGLLRPCWHSTSAALLQPRKPSGGERSWLLAKCATLAGTLFSCRMCWQSWSAASGKT